MPDRWSRNCESLRHDPLVGLILPAAKGYRKIRTHRASRQLYFSTTWRAVPRPLGAVDCVATTLAPGPRGLTDSGYLARARSTIRIKLGPQAGGFGLKDCTDAIGGEKALAARCGQFFRILNKHIDFLAGMIRRDTRSSSSRERRSASYPNPPSRPLALLEIIFKKNRIKTRAEILPQVLSKSADITIREIATRGSLQTSERLRMRAS